MDGGKTLLDRCLSSLIPEPLVFVLDNDGNRRLESKPLRTIIDVSNLPWGNWLKLDGAAGKVTITLGGESVVYKRVGYDVHDWWVCDKC